MKRKFIPKKFQKLMSRCCVHDFTSSAKNGSSHDEILTWLKENCKKWCFQKEKGENDYEHYQGRFSLKKKAYAKDIVHPFSHLTITSKENTNNNFYVLKKETRIAGPWKDDDPYIPKAVRETNLYPFQQKVRDHRDNDRIINVVINEGGAGGKTHICKYIDTNRLGTAIIPMKGHKDIMRQVMNQPKTELYVIDIPRAFPKKDLAELYAAVESIKDGYAYDDRYKFKKEWFEPPTIWIFTNEEPKEAWLSKDRWRLWTIDPKTMDFKVRTFPGARFAPCNTRRNKSFISLEKSGLVGPGLDRIRTESDMSDDDKILEKEIEECIVLSDSDSE